jgi:hypothetical protein
MRKHVSRIALFVAIMVVSGGAVGSFTAAPPAEAATRSDVMAAWHGFWTRAGYVYEADAAFAVAPNNTVDGSINWTVRRSPKPEEQAKIGLTGVEHVSGIFLPDSGVLRLEGTSRDDPNTILGLDKYRLILSDDANVLGGITWGGGTWDSSC